MSKELEALKKLKPIRPSLWQEDCFNVIEKALKQYEEDKNILVC